MSVLKRLLPALFFVLPGVLNHSPCYSQNIVNTENSSDKVFLVRTKQFNEFIDRFNYKTNFNGDPVDSVFKSKIPRDKMINSLFDLRDPRINPSDKAYSGKYTEKKTEFINDVVQNNLLVYKYSDKILAEAKSRILFKGTPKTIRIFLSQEIVGKDMVKWVIINVKGELFNFLKTDTAFIRFIPPSSNETDFINLKRALEDIDHLQYYSTKEYDPDYLIVFYYMLNAGLVKFEYVEEVIYHITNLNRWNIEVKEFKRNEMNSGWLISDIEKKSDNGTDFLKTIK